MSTAAIPEISSQNSASGPGFNLSQRILLWLITWAGFLVVRLIGPTLRFSVSWEDGAPASLEERPLIYSFWHSCMIPAMYLWRNLQVRVMSSDSFDGEYTGRIMRKFGFVKIRGSSSKGAVKALLSMRRELEQGHVERAWAESVHAELRAAEADPASYMITPLVVEIIARKPD